MNEGYDRALIAESKGLLKGNPNTRVGDFVDRFSASEYRDWLAAEGIPEGPGQFVQMNRWLRDPAGSRLYMRPDIRIPSSGSILDATVGWKSSTDTQIVRFNAFSGGNRITIVRPEQLGGSYSIWPRGRQMARVKDIDSLYDFIGYVVLCAPDRFPVRDYLPPDGQMSLDKAFEELHHGIDLIDPDMADDAKRTHLASLLDQALAAYKARDEVKGAHLVQDFQDLIFKRNDG